MPKMKEMIGIRICSQIMIFHRLFPISLPDFRVLDLKLN